MKKIRADVEALVGKELELANQNNPPFNSRHEGWAVIREEVIECQQEVDDVDAWLMDMDSCVRHNRDTAAAVNALEESAVNAACEAIQVAAMCRKFRALECKDAGVP